jgi:hypothetical protein
VTLRTGDEDASDPAVSRFSSIARSCTRRTGRLLGLCTAGNLHLQEVPALLLLLFMVCCAAILLEAMLELA